MHFFEIYVALDYWCFFQRFLYFVVVWQLSDHGMVERFVAERRICRVHGISHH